ncbi:hypothetical protein E0L36_14690 [Streptomyces sp. AJS327]|uniref:hypothetical protein n=1 Tax=Streptomyces sp. AJS327 TaxID=2545265 RepID=UPI0015DECC1D|nr:hypothetical protein [Streptomyces sp. AJS327]MBA0052103.1 hypothetical protein [Streptomyces sp. AJS327]
MTKRAGGSTARPTSLGVLGVLGVLGALGLGLTGCGLGDDGDAEKPDATKSGPYDPAKAVRTKADVRAMLPGDGEVPGGWEDAVDGPKALSGHYAERYCGSWAGKGCSKALVMGETSYAYDGNVNFRILTFADKSAARAAYRGVFATEESTGERTPGKAQRVGSESRTLRASGDRADAVTILRVGTVVARVNSYLNGPGPDGDEVAAMQADRIAQVLRGEKPTATLR